MKKFSSIIFNKNTIKNWPVEVLEMLSGCNGFA